VRERRDLEERYGSDEYPRRFGERARERAVEPVGVYGPRDYGLADGPYRGIGPRNYARSDDRIRDDVAERLTAHGGIDASGVEFDVIQAEVVLFGWVPNRRMRRLAEDVVDEVPGVRDVRNEIRVSGAGDLGSREERFRGGATGVLPATGGRTVFAVFDERDRAEDAINELREAGFGRDDISLIARSEREARELAGSTGAETKAAGAGVVLGGIAGGAVGWLVGIGALAIPGLGPVVALGALGTTLAGAAAGAAAGGLIGALVGLGVPEEQARTYEAAIKKGAILVSVSADNDSEIRRAREILQRNGASEIRDYDAREARQRFGREPTMDEREMRERERAEVR
jgi:hypothetical protein